VSRPKELSLASRVGHRRCALPIEKQRPVSEYVRFLRRVEFYRQSGRECVVRRFMEMRLQNDRSRRSGSRRVSYRARDAQFRFGIEEEYFLADARSLRVVHESPAALFDPAHGSAAPRLHREFLQSQLEVATRPHVSVADARLDLVQLRRRAAAAAAEHDMVILAAGTHPTARWRAGLVACVVGDAAIFQVSDTGTQGA
jgi:Glutamate-cysteine ligase family 2(GCS2)